MRVTAKRLVGWFLAASAVSAIGGCTDTRNHYEVDRLVSDNTTAVSASHQDPRLVNAWGLAASPTGPWWVANAGSDYSTVYNAEGVKDASLEVHVPGSPTGMVYHDGIGLAVSGQTSRFVFATESGTILAWAPELQPASEAPVVVASTHGAIYKGLAIATVNGSERLYATDFHNARVDVFDSMWQPVSLAANAFRDDGLPAGFAPFGIRQMNGVVFVTFAKQDADAEDDVAGEGLGYVDAFDPQGTLLYRVASAKRLNAPWGLAVAPTDWGAFGGMLLVGNFGDGRINVFDLRLCGTNGCNDVGTLEDRNGSVVAIEGLWALDFGKGNANSGDTDELYFTSGPGDEAHGLFGYVDVATK